MANNPVRPSLLFAEGFTMVHDGLAKALGSFDLAALVGLIRRWHVRHQADWVYLNQSSVVDMYGWTKEKQTKMVGKLERLGVLVTKRTGLPCRKWLQLDLDALERLSNPGQTMIPGGICSIPETPDTGDRGFPDTPIKKREERKDTVASPTDTTTERAAGGVPCGYSTQQEDPMFFDQLATKADYTDHHLQQATRLRDAIRQRWQGAARAPSMAKWAATLAKLDRQQDPAQVAKVFEWYLSAMGDEFVPVAQSANGFKTKWVALQAAYLRANPVAVPLTGPAKALTAKLLASGMTWPNGAKDRLGAAVDVWLDWVNQLKARVREWQLQDLTEAWGDYGHYVAQHAGRAYPPWVLVYPRLVKANRAVPQLLHALQNPESFVLMWFRNYNREVAGWSDWSGRFPSPGTDALKKLPMYAGWQEGLDLLFDELAGTADRPTPPTPDDLTMYEANTRPLPKV